MRNILLLVTAKLFMTFLPFNLFGQQFSGIEIIGFGDCRIQEKLYFFKLGGTKGIDRVLFDLCDGKIHAAKVIDQDNAVITNRMEAIINFYDFDKEYFDVDIRSSDSKQNLYKLSRISDGMATLRKVTGNNNSNSNMLADEYFYIHQSSSGIQAIKKKMFDCRRIQFIDIKGQIIANYNYDSSYYYFSLDGLSSGVYFLIFTTDEIEVLKKITVINQ